MDSALKKEIIDFININFSNNRKTLIPKINEYLSNPRITNQLYNTFTNNVTTLFHFQSLNSIKETRKKNEIGDISDIWTFYLNEDINEIETIDEYPDWDCENYLKKGKELHLCRVWINWFLNVYYIETSYHKKNTTIEENGILFELKKQEQETYSKIIEILANNNIRKLDTNFIEEKIKNVQTDCNEYPTIFDCLFSDIVHPTKNRRITRQKVSGIEIFVIEKLNENKLVIEKQMLFGNGNYNCYRIDFDVNNKIINSLNNKQIQKENR